MSLYILPVSVSDLTQLQLGIEFFPDTTEATTEAGLINQQTATVDSYAVQLLANNISFSQVAMAVDSMMFGMTDYIFELTKLATQFLPPQVNNAVKYGLNPTVYAAEALGLALAGGNGTSNAFATEFGSLSVEQFTAEVASLTGVNPLAIHNFVLNWISFYTANPSAIGSLSVTLAAYGAAFGDAVGTALLNPTFNGTIALVDDEVQNALIDNAEGSYQSSIALAAQPFHLPLEGEAFLIANAGGLPFGQLIDWASAQFPGAAFDYAQFSSPQVGKLNIFDAPSTFTLDTQHFATNAVEIDAKDNSGNLCTLILGDSTAKEDFSSVTVNEYQTVHIVANGPTVVSRDSVTLLDFLPPTLNHGQVLISGNTSLILGDLSPSERAGNVSVAVSGTITDVGVVLYLGVTDAETIDASNAPDLLMVGPAIPTAGSGVTVLGGYAGNVMQGSLGGQLSTVTFPNQTTGLSATFVGADNITGGPGGGDFIFGDGGPDTITLPSNHLHSDRVGFGFDNDASIPDGFGVLAITNGLDQVFHGFWDVVAGGPAVPTAIPDVFLDSTTGGTSLDMTTINGFHAGSGGDNLIFDTAAWNGASIGVFDTPATSGDLVRLDGGVVLPSAAQLSAVWANNLSNSSLEDSDNVLRYAPAGGSPHNAQELAAQLHGASGAIVLPGNILPGQDQHILVAYDATPHVFPIQHVVHIADVDLVNTTTSNQSSTANLNVYASDMVSLVGVSLSSLMPDNIHFI
jgi:hypothetical protein